MLLPIICLLIYIFLKKSYKDTKINSKKMKSSSNTESVLLLDKNGNITNENSNIVTVINANTETKTLDTDTINVDKVCSITDPNTCITLGDIISFITGNTKLNLETEDMVIYRNNNKIWSTMDVKNLKEKKATKDKRVYFTNYKPARLNEFRGFFTSNYPGNRIFSKYIPGQRTYINQLSTSPIT